MQRKKPLTRKTPLRTKKPMGARKPMSATTATRLRDTATDPADAVWTLLADRAGPPFRRHEKLGTVVADFYCPAARLAVVIGDAPRAAVLEAAGYRVIAAAAEDSPQSVCDAVDDAFALRLVSR